MNSSWRADFVLARYARSAARTLSILSVYCAFSFSGAENGDYVIAWESWYQDGSSAGVYAQRYAMDGAAQGGEFLVNTYTSNNQENPAVAVDALGDFMVGWHGYGQDSSGHGVKCRTDPFW